MMSIVKLQPSNVFLFPLDDTLFDLRNTYRELPYFINKFLKTYFISHYPDNTIVAGLDVFYNTNNRILEVDISPGVAIVDRTLINMTTPVKLSINATRYPTSTIYVVYVYQDWSKENKFRIPELGITPIIDNRISDERIDLNKGFLPLNIVQINHDNNSIISVTDLSNLPIEINNTTIQINRYSYESISTTPSSEINLNIHSETIKITPSMITNKRAALSRGVHPDFPHLTKLYVLDETRTQISPMLIYGIYYKIIFPNIIDWNNLQLQNLLSQNEFIHVEYYITTT